MSSPKLDDEWQKCIIEGKPEADQKPCDEHYMAQNLYQGKYIAQVRPPLPPFNLAIAKLTK
jgi:hypothetical protein